MIVNNRHLKLYYLAVNKSPVFVVGMSECVGHCAFSCYKLGVHP
jgi:hypothetical protein